jgi:hypothetical protein
MAMLSKIKGGAVRLRWGVAALAIAAPLAIPAAASASTSVGPLNSWNPPARTFVNVDRTLTMQNRRTNFTADFQLDQASSPVITADNHVDAAVADCHDCGAIAIGFQVVYVSKTDVTTINANNDVNSTADYCVRCSLVGEGYLIVVATGPQSQPLTSSQLQSLYQVKLQLEALRSSGDDNPSDIQTQTDAMASTIVSILTDPPANGPDDISSAVTPAITSPGFNGSLTGNNRPFVHVYSSFKR